MPLIAREGHYEIRVYPKDHPPPHVHVYFAGRRVRVRLHDLVIIDEVSAKPHERKEIQAAVHKHLIAALQTWEEIVEKGGKKDE